MSGFSMSPFSKLWLVGTDMGTLFRSLDQGMTWTPIDQRQVRFPTNLSFVGPVGFSADSQTLFFAPCNGGPASSDPCVAKRSSDGGVTWSNMNVNAGNRTVFNIPSYPPQSQRAPLYWPSSLFNADLVFAATVDGLDVTRDRGATWSRVVDGGASAPISLTGPSRGTFLDERASSLPPTMYHATPSGIFAWQDGNMSSFRSLIPGYIGTILSFAGGYSTSTGALTLAFVDNNSSACLNLMPYGWSSASAQNATLASCGWLRVSLDGGVTWIVTNQPAAKVVMSTQDPSTIYALGSGSWDKAYGSRVWKAVIVQGVQSSSDISFALMFDQVDPDHNYAIWPASKLEYSAVGLDVGYFDNGYYHFAVNPTNSNEIGGSQNFFLHVSRDAGQTWTSPFTRFRDQCSSSGSRGSGMRWSSVGLEVTHFYFMKHNPINPQLMVAGAADVRGLVTEDGGSTWRILDGSPSHRSGSTLPGINSVYAVAFSPTNPDVFYVAASKWHDWPYNWYSAPLSGNGGVFVTQDRGRSFSRVGSVDSISCSGCSDMRADFLSIAISSDGNTLYAGTHSGGIARCQVGGPWTWINSGIVGPSLTAAQTIVPSIQIDPVLGDVYCLVSGNGSPGNLASYTNQAVTGVYRLPFGSSTWQLLRTSNISGFSTDLPWYYPTAFDIDWNSRPSSSTPPSVIYLTDFYFAGIQVSSTYSKSTGLWRTTDGGQSWQQTLSLFWPTSVQVDTQSTVTSGRSSRVYVSGQMSISPWGGQVSAPGQWGSGGHLWSDDGGDTWTANSAIPGQAVQRSSWVDPLDHCSLWYITAGLALIKGPAPNNSVLPGCVASSPPSTNLIVLDRRI
jgi:hypothetical protein